ncbi:MAG: helix-turn-helix transcriptional regulator [Maribacter sp.]|nr:helix-turn-helix transcriptional regulator [Maribacter sp.]
MDQIFSYGIKVSQREAEVLVLMSEGFTSKEIGRQLYLSNLTVDKHKSNLLAKFNARNSAHLVVKAWKKGIINEHFARVLKQRWVDNDMPAERSSDL